VASILIRTFLTWITALSAVRANKIHALNASRCFFTVHYAKNSIAFSLDIVFHVQMVNTRMGEPKAALIAQLTAVFANQPPHVQLATMGTPILLRVAPNASIITT